MIAQWLYRMATAGRLRKFEKLLRDPMTTQHNTLMSIIAANAQSDYCIRHNFSDIKTIDDYRRQAPVGDYEIFRKYVDNAIGGAKAILTSASPCGYAITSGTTSAPKHIPVTTKSRQVAYEALRLWTARLIRDHPGFLSGKSGVIAGLAEEGFFQTGIPYGSMSGIVRSQVPAAIKRRFALPDEVLKVSDHDTRYFLISRFLLGADLSHIGAPNPSTLIRLAELIEKDKELLIRAIHDGTIGVPINGNPQLADLAAMVKSEPKRASFLEMLAAQNVSFAPKLYWPKLAAVTCWLGGSVAQSAANLPMWYGQRAAMRDIGYMASEGTFTIPISNNTASGVPMIGSVFFEFIPEGCMDDENPPTLLLHEIEEGKQYGVVLTTYGGLYRYDINDVVKVTGFYKGTPLIAFVRKGRDMTSITGEKISVHHVMAAMEEADKRHGISPKAYRVIADTAKSQYHFLIEPDSSGIPNNLAPVENTLDESLRQVNIEYDQKRDSKRLNAPLISLMRSGWADTERRSFLETGRSDIQFKWKFLLDEPTKTDIAYQVTTHQRLG